MRQSQTRQGCKKTPKTNNTVGDENYAWNICQEIWVIQNWVHQRQRLVSCSRAAPQQPRFTETSDIYWLLTLGTMWWRQMLLNMRDEDTSLQGWNTTDKIKRIFKHKYLLLWRISSSPICIWDSWGVLYYDKDKVVNGDEKMRLRYLCCILDYIRSVVWCSWWAESLSACSTSVTQRPL